MLPKNLKMINKKKQPVKEARKPIDRNDPRYQLYKSLPFKKRKMDFTDWIYKNKLGVGAIVVTLVVFFFMFESIKINLTEIVLTDGFIMETPKEEVEEVEEEPKKEELTPEMLEQQIYEQVKNVSVNDNTRLDAGLKDDKGTNASEIYKEAQALEQKLNASKEAHNRDMQEIAQLERELEQSAKKKGGEDEKKIKDVNVDGKVTVRYDLGGRRASSLPVPAYKCEQGGEVVVSVTVNDNGDVIDAKVSKTSSRSNDCINDTALEFAKRTRFELGSEWPSKNKGTITYMFLNQ